MLMRETPLDSLDRTRGIFLSSLLDGIGKADAGADFYFAVVNAIRHGYVLDSNDNGLIKMFSSVIRKEEEISGPSYAYDLNTEGEKDAMQESGVSQLQAGEVMSSPAGMGLSDNPSYDEMRVIPPVPGQGLSGRQFRMHQGHSEDPYANHNYLGSYMNPLHGNMHDIVGDFYYDDEGFSQSQKDAKKEVEWEGNAVGANHEFLLNPNYYGKLDTNHGTNHALYEQDFRGWKTNNLDIENRLKEHGLDDSQIEHELRKMHIAQKKREWKSNFGLMDYLFGMEWLTPEERNKAYEHIYKYGTAHPTQQLKFNRHDNNIDFIPRMVRNFHQRFAGLYNHWIREPSAVGETITYKPKNLTDKSKYIDPAHTIGSLERYTEPGVEGDAYKRLLDYYRDMYYDYTGEMPDYINNASVPYLEKNSDGSFDVDNVGWQKRETANRSNYLHNEMFRHLLGVDHNYQLHEDGQHPLWGDLWKKDQAPFNQEQVDKIVNERNRYSVQETNSDRLGKNHAAHNYATFLDSEKYNRPEHGYNLEDNESLSTYWQRPFLGKGGLGKQPNDLFNLLHHHTLEYKPKEKKQERELTEREKEMLEMGREFGEEEDEEEVDFDYEPHVSKTKFGGEKQHSLLFSRVANSIVPRHHIDSDDVNMRDHSLLNLLGPFGQAEIGLFGMMDRGQFRLVPQVGGGATVEMSQEGTGEATATLNPHNTSRSSRYGASTNPYTERHSYALDHATANKLSSDYHNARETGQNSQEFQNKLSGKVPGYLYVGHRFPAKGGAYDEEVQRIKGSHDYHHTGTLLGMGNAPMNPYPMVLSHKDKRAKSTLASGDLDALRTKKVPAKETRGFDKLEDAKDDLRLRYNLISDNATTDEQKKEVEEEYQRALARLEENFMTAYPTPYKETKEGVVQSLDINPEYAGFGNLLSQVSQRQPVTEEQERYFDLVDRQQMLIQERDSEETSPKRKTELNTRIHEMTDEISRLEPLLEEGSDSKFDFGNYQTQMIDKERRLRADTDAIAEMGAKLKDKIDPEMLAHIFDPNLPHETVAANIRMWAKLANDYLNTVPHKHHGVYTKGTAEYTEAAGLPQQIKSAMHRINPDLGISINNMFTAEGIENEQTNMMDKLGLDSKNPRLRQTINDYFENQLMNRLGQFGEINAPVMTVRQLFEQMYPDVDIDSLLKHSNKRVDEDLRQKVLGLYRNIQDNDKNQEVGMHLHTALSTDHRATDNDLYDFQGNVKIPKFGNVKNKKIDDKIDKYYQTLQRLNSIVTAFPEVESPAGLTRTGITDVPVGPVSPDGHSVHSLYNSAGFAHEFGDEFNPNFDYKINHKTGEVAIKPVPQGHSQRLVQPLETFWNAVAPDEWLRMLRGPEHQEAREDLDTLERMAAQFKPNSIGETRHQDHHSATKSEVNLANLTNPDIIKKELGKKVPTLQPMHRIFDLDDLEHLRGFTGDWIVSAMPEGERGFVEKEDDEVSSETFELSEEDKDNFKQVTDEDFKADVIKTEEGYYIFDVLKFAEKEVHDVPISDRIKILRGGMEGVENVHVPSASDTRLTDDEGLKSVIADLQKDHEQILLRDAKSVYMAGELRHPKWVMLKPGRDVVLRVLERRGNGPYTYRLGTGPITQEENIGNRAVESDGENYMDVGVAFNSPEKYNEGDHVRVNAANVSKVETVDEDAVYTLTGSEIIGEAEGEGLVSRETLGLLAKSLDSQWLCEVTRAKSGIRITMPQGDVVYKATQSGYAWTVHSPLASNNYLIRLAESQRVYWSPIAGALLKANLEIKEEVHESEGDAEPLIEPKKIEDSDWWKKKEKQKVLVKGLALIDKFLKSGVGAVGQSSTGAMGLGIGYATPIESPMGPTNLHDEKTMPDFDNRKRPGEDESIEPNTEDLEDDKRITVPTKEGVLEVTSDKATFRT